ncbi:MAG: glucosamine-6-phosphate deaminase, partial [Clostridiales bacterium]|nr:glucosamine-6-phosphate deaminase [Clostridiales bacterium]
YEKEIKMAGGIDFQILGIGENGHIGFNEPDVNFEATTHLVTLDERTISSNSRFFCSKEEVPRQAVSMGIKTIMQSKKILLIANGAAKADAIEQMVYGKISPYVPATILQLHPDVTVIVDKLAGSRLMRESSFVR